jgi:hypothetical protein
MADKKPNFQPRSNKSQQSRQQSAQRKANQQARGSGKFGNGSNVHNGASRSQSGQSNRKKSSGRNFLGF